LCGASKVGGVDEEAEGTPRCEYKLKRGMVPLLNLYPRDKKIGARRYLTGGAKG
jgi:hypothetical protein